MAMKLIYWPAPILKQVSAVVTEPVEASFIAEMKGIMAKHKGIGLAAIQVGVPKRIIVTDNAGPTVFVNPVITDRIGEKTPLVEGCLSVPGFYEQVPRYEKIAVTYQDENLREYKSVVFMGQLAHVLQHEIEHLDGRLMTDHMPPSKRDQIRAFLRKLGMKK